MYFVVQVLELLVLLFLPAHQDLHQDLSLQLLFKIKKFKQKINNYRNK